MEKGPGEKTDIGGSAVRCIEEKQEEMMTRTSLYEIAFCYKKSKIWKYLSDREVFAVSLKSGEVGYVTIMGAAGEYCALGLYIGEEGFQGYRAIANYVVGGDEFEDREKLLCQDELQLAFVMKDELTPEEEEEAYAYAKKNGIRFSGANAYPKFIRFQKYHYPWKVTQKKEIEQLYEAVEAAVLLAERLKNETPEMLGIFSIDYDTKDVPFFEVKGGKLVSNGRTPIPAEKKEKTKNAINQNQIGERQLKNLPKRSVWEAQYVRMPEPAQENPKTAPYYPLLLFITEKMSGFLNLVPPVMEGEENLQGMLDEFILSWNKLGHAPKEIRCADERTLAYLQDICEKAGIKIGLYKGDFSALCEAKQGFLRSLRNSDYLYDEDDEESGPFGDEDDGEFLGDNTEALKGFVRDFCSLPIDELKKMPKQFLADIKSMLEEGVFPPEYEKQLKDKLKKLRI